MENQFSKKTRKKARSIQAQRIFRSRWFKSLVAMGSVVVFCTVYSLIIPAATLTEDEASADAGIVLQEAAPSEEAVVETAAEAPAPEPVQEEVSKEEPVVQAAAAVEEAPAEQTKEAPTAASSETVTETPAEAASTAASTEQSLNESAAAGSGSEETKTENAETANTAAANETAPAEETSGTATDETATEGTDAALTTEKTTEEASTADSEESVEKTTGEEEEVGTVSELKGTSGNLEAVVRFAEGAGIPENATLAIYGGSADTGKVQDALWSGSTDSIEQSTITTDLSEYVSFAVKDVDGNDITPDSDCSIEISFGSEANLSDPGENRIKKYGTLVVGSDGNVSVTGTSLSTGDGHTYATFSGKLSGNTFGFAVTTADKKVNYLEGLSGKTSDGAVEASLTFGKDAKVPEGSTLTVESASVSESSVLDKLWVHYEGVDKDTVTADDVQFVKFVIRDKDDKEISPETKVSVKLTFHHEADLSSAAEGKVKKYNALAVSSDGTITLGSKALSAENGTTTASFADVSAKSSLGYAVSSADKKVVYATRLTGKSEDGTIEASLRLTEEAKIPEGSLLKVTPVTGESVQKTLLDNIWTDTSIVDPDTIELTDSGLAAVTITDKDGIALKPEADATLTLTFNKEADLKEAARKMVKRAKTVAMTEENVKLSDDGISAAEGKTKVSYTGIVDGQTFGYAVSTAKQKTNFLEGKLTYKGEDYTVEVSINKDNQIPEGAKLSVGELGSKSNDYQNKLDQAQEAILKEAQKKTSEDVEVALNEASAHLYDISLENEDGEKIQPNGKVTVKITYDSAIQITKDESMQTVHFNENADERQVLSTKVTEETNGDSKKVSAISFDTDGFSVYAIVGAEEKTAELKGVANTLGAAIGNVAFKVSYDADAGLPDGTKLVVKSVDADNYSDATAKALGDVEIVDEKYFDICFKYDGKKIEPKANVNVTITLTGDDAFTKGDDVKVVHFVDGEDTPDVLDADVSGGKDVETSSAAKPNFLLRAVRSLAPKKNADTDSVITFKSNSFSVYGVVETQDSTKIQFTRRTYKFTNDDKKPYTFTLNKNPESGQVTPDTDEQIVKNGDTLADVGIPVSTDDSNKEFTGWAIVNNDGTLGKPFKLPTTIDDIPAGTDQTVTLRAVYSDQIKITFYDVDNKTILHTVKAKPGTTFDLSQYDAVPKSAEQGFLGWSTEQDKTSGALNNSYIVPDTDTSLYPVIATGHWLRFDKNDEDDDPTEATYTNPVFVTGNVTPGDEPAKPTRTGYTFAGWYEKKDGKENEYSFSGELTASKTLYAKWTPEEVKYRVVYWEENPDDYGFSYYRSGELTGIAGQKTKIGNIDLKDKDGNIIKGFHHHYSDEKDRKDSDHLEHKTEDVVIKGDGTTVVNVYYDRDIYTVMFINQNNAKPATYESDKNGDYYYVDGYDWNDGYWYLDTNRKRFKKAYYKIGEPYGSNSKINGNQVNFTYYTKIWDGSWQVHHGSSQRYTQTGGSDGTIDELTITAKYGADIANQWPSRRTELNRTYPVNWAVTKAGASGEMQANISTMPLDGATYYYVQEGTSYTFKETYYTQNISGEDAFTIDHTDTIRWNGNLYTSVADYYDLRGFKPIFASKDDAGNVSSYVLRSTIPTDKHVSVRVGTSIGEEGTYDENDNSYNVNFYYARNQYEIEFTPNDGNYTEDITRSYYYQASIANAAPDFYKNRVTTVRASNGDTKTFAGWYDNPYGSGDEYDFTGKTMPANNIHLYGKWVPTSYTFTVDPNGGTFKDNTTANKEMTNVPYGTVISEDDYRNPTRFGYEFIGWYQKNDDGTETVYDFATSVTRDINLIAHWRETGSFGVRYINTDPTQTPVADGAQLTVDTYSYADLAEVKVLGAPTGNEIPKGYEFVGWSDGTNTYVPGDTFVLDASKAEKLTVDGKEGQYITLKARYTKLDTTWLNYDANGGSGDLIDPTGITNNQQVNIPMNTQVTLSSGQGFTRTGYKLIGWNSDKTKATTGEVEWNTSEKVGVDGVDGNTLYAVWAPVYVNVSFTKKGEQIGSENTKPLAGAQFFLTNGTVTKSVTSDENGSVSFNGENAVQAPTTDVGNIQLSETSAPDGYEVAQGSPWTVTYDVANAQMASDGKYYVAGTIKNGNEDITEIIDPISKTDINIVKEDLNGNKLTGASFTLKIKGKDGTKDIAATATSGLDNKDGKFTINGEIGVVIKGLPVGQYVLTENQAPDGYIINTSDVEFTVTKDGVTVKEGTDKKLATALGKTLTVKNTPGQALPNTGGHGTLPFVIGGMFLISAAGMLYIISKKRSALN